MSRRLEVEAITRALTAAAVWTTFSVCAGCSRTTQPPPLASVPAGDTAWRAALAAATEPDARSALCAEIDRLAAAHADRWEPRWASYKCAEAALSPAETLDRLTPVHALAVERRDATGQAAIGSDLAWGLLLAGRIEDAERAFLAARASAESAARPDLQAAIDNNLAGLLIERGRFAAARERLAAAIASYQAEGRELQARQSRFNLAVVLSELGNAAEAERTLRTLLAPAHSVDDGAIADAAAVTLGWIASMRRDSAAALDWFSRVPDRHRDLAGRAHYNLARELLTMHRPREAQHALERCRTLLDAPQSVTALDADSLEIEAQRQLGDLVAAERIARTTIERADAATADEPSWLARWRLARVLRDADRQEEARALLHETISRVEAQRATLELAGEGLGFLRTRAEPFVELAALERRTPETVLRLAGRLHAVALRRGTNDESAAGPTSLDALRASLAAGELMVVYLIGEEQGVALGIRRDAVQVVEIAGLQQLAPRIGALRAALGSAPRKDGPPVPGGPAPENSAAALTRLLIEPLRELLPATRRIYLVSDRDLALLPFAALPDPLAPGQPLIARCEIAALPYAAPPPRFTRRAERVLLAGAPEFGPDSAWGPLPWSAVELSRLQKLWGAGRTVTLSGAQFSPDLLRDSTRAPLTIVHLATHAVASTLDPRECGVIFSGGARMGLDELAALPLRDALLVLSACRTGEGEIVAGEGVIGLSRAAMRAGARAVVASHWSVDDADSARLMIELHRRLLAGDDPITALAAAQRTLRAVEPDPARWAPHGVIVSPSSTN